MKNKPLFLIALIPLVGACSFLGENPSALTKQMLTGSIVFGSERSDGTSFFEREYWTSKGFPLFSLTSEHLYSDGSNHAVRFEKKNENISSLSLTFQKAVEISKIRFFTFGTTGSKLNVTFSDAEMETITNKTSAYSDAIFDTLLFPSEREIDYLFLSNLSSDSIQLAKIEFEYFENSKGSTSQTSSDRNSSSSSSIVSIESSLSSETSKSSTKSESDSKEVTIDEGEANPDWPILASQNASWPSETYEYRLKPTLVESDIAPIYTLSKRGDEYIKTLVKYLSKEKKCFTYEDVCEYYMAFRALPSNYTLDSSPEKGSRIERRYQVFSRKKHYSTDYPSKLGTFNNPTSGLYYELDIDLTGSYNKGTGSYSRGAGRVVIVPEGLSENGYDTEPVCYFTLDHYADFVEYYNFSNGWSAPFRGVYNKSGSYENSPFTEVDRKNPLTITL